MIDFRTLIGLQLKSDPILELLEMHELQVIYDIDTLHENIPDAYWIEDRKHGFTLKADEAQRIVVCFIYLRALEGHDAFSGEVPGVVIANNRISDLGEPSKSGSFSGRNWVRYDRPEHSVHLTWDTEGPAVLSILHPSAVR